MERAGRLGAAVVLLLVGAAPGRAQSGFRPTIEGGRNLISRDVAGERWAITENLDDGTLTGNVFSPDGGPPAFVQCEPTSVVENPDPSETLYTYDCYGSATCTTQGCPDWAFIASVTLAGSFFEAPPPQPSPSATPSATPTATSRPTPTPSPRPTPTPTPAKTPAPAPTPTPTPKPSPTPTPTPKPSPLVVTPDKATVGVGEEFLFVVTGGVPPYELHVTIGGTVDPPTLQAAGSPFTFTATAAGTSTVIVVDSLTVVKTVPITVK